MHLDPACFGAASACDAHISVFASFHPSFSLLFSHHRGTSWFCSIISFTSDSAPPCHYSDAHRDRSHSYSRPPISSSSTSSPNPQHPLPPLTSTTTKEKPTQTYLPRIIDLEALRRFHLIRLSSQIPGKSSIAVHHACVPVADAVAVLLPTVLGVSEAAESDAGDDEHLV